jgi:hypothetical protein
VVQPKQAIGMPAARPPHPATVVQPKQAFGLSAARPPHPATVVQPKQAFGLSAARPPHPATVVQPMRGGGGPSGGKRFTLGPLNDIHISKYMDKAAPLLMLTVPMATGLRLERVQQLTAAEREELGAAISAAIARFTESPRTRQEYVLDVTNAERGGGAA